MHILMIRFSSMGDIVLQTATINWLKSLFGKNVKLSFVTSSEFVSLIDQHPEISHVVGFNRKGGEKWADLIGKIDKLDRERPIDLILDLHATLRSFRLRCSFWTIPALTVDKRRWERFLLTKMMSLSLKRFIYKKIWGLETQVERIITDFQNIFGDLSGYRRTQDYRRGPHHEVTSLLLPPSYPLPEPYIVLAPSASFKYKRWPIGHFVKLAEELLDKTNQNIVILAGPDDHFCEAFSEIKSPRIHNLQGKTSLKESMSVLSRATLCIGNDSGMNHITEAYGLPCLTIFGPTDPRFGFAPHGKDSKFLSHNLWCKPCSTTGKKDCFRDKHYCMENISVEEVIGDALSILGTP